jgi:protein gp37
MGDLFHVDVPRAFVRAVFETMLEASEHVYQVLTKRPGRMGQFIRANSDLFDHGVVPAHIWLGTSVENQRTVFRVRQLTQIAASVRFLSCEPLLGPLRISLQGIHWVIAGGESGITHRPVSLDWVREIRDACIRGAVPFFFKQVGGRTPKANGRTLDGRTWNEYPAIDRTAPA